MSAVEVNKYNTLYYLWAASIIAGSLWAGSGWGAITFPSIPANMQRFVLIDISTHVCPLFSSRHEGTKAPRKRNKKKFLCGKHFLVPSKVDGLVKIGLFTTPSILLSVIFISFNSTY